MHAPEPSRWRTILHDARALRGGRLALALAPAVFVAWPIARKTPLSIDHTAHLVQAWHYWTEMLGRGRLRGWSHDWAFGFPSDELVPPGSAIWVCIVRALTLGQLSWERTYALAFAVFLLLIAYAGYRFGKTYFGPVAGVVCAWLTIFDRGGMLEGGWTWHTQFGVWPVSLGGALALLALVRLERILGRPDFGLRDVIAGGGLVAAALLTHPMAILFFGVTLPLRLLAHRWVAPPPQARGWLWATAAIAFGIAASSWFYVPFFARAGESQDLGWLAYSLPELAEHVLQLRMFQNTWQGGQALGLFGLALALVRVRRPGVFVALSAAAFLLLSSDVLIRDLHLHRVMPSLIKIETNRMLLLCKLMWFPLAGHAVAEVGRWIGKVVRTTPQRVIVGLAGALVVAAAVGPQRTELYERHLDLPIRGAGDAGLAHWTSFRAALDYLAELERDSTEFYRIAYAMKATNHMSALSTMYTGAPTYKIGYTPAQVFRKFPTTGEPEVLAAARVKYVVSSNPIDDDETYAFDRKFGRFHVYRFVPYVPDPFTVRGPGRGELLEFEPERIRIRLSGTDATSRLAIHVANFERWEATIDGDVVPIQTVPVYGVEYPILMEIPARDGEVELRYVYRRPDVLGVVVTWAALPLLLLGWHQRRRLDALALAVQARCTTAGVVLGTAIAVLLVVAVSLPKLRDRRTMLRPDSLVRSVDPTDIRFGDTPCEAEGPLVYRCGARRLQAEVVAGRWGLHFCLHSPDDGVLSMRTRTVLGSFVVVDYDPAKRGKGSITVRVDGRSIGKAATRPYELRQQTLAFDTRPHAGREAELELEVRGAALNCFDWRLEG